MMNEATFIEGMTLITIALGLMAAAKDDQTKAETAMAIISALEEMRQGIYHD